MPYVMILPLFRIVQCSYYLTALLGYRCFFKNYITLAQVSCVNLFCLLTLVRADVAIRDLRIAIHLCLVSESICAAMLTLAVSVQLQQTCAA